MKELDFDTIITEANRLGRIMHLLHEAASQDMEAVFDELYDDQLQEDSQTLFGIAAVLTLLKKTPNASVNAEGMAAIRKEIEGAAEIEQLPWAQEILADIPAETF